ncbi:MAG: DUF2079 domain-containing protein [Patescibacteria group bacterium]
MPRENNKTYAGALVFLIAASILIHIAPFVLYEAHPLGYDTGFYRRYIVQQPDLFLNASVPGLGADAFVPRVFLDILRLTHLPPDLLLYGAYIALFTTQAIALFLLIKKRWGAKTALWAALLLIVSPIQYTAYWFVLFKNAFALPLMLLAFFALEKGSRWAILLGVLLAFSHHTTSIIFLAAILIYAVLRRERRRLALLTAAVAIPAFLYLHYPAIPDYVNAPVAVFVQWKEYLLLSLPLFILASFGIKDAVRNASRSTVAAFFIVSAAFPLLGLPFYQRIFIFTDIALIIPAAVGLVKIAEALKSRDRSPIKIAAALIAILSLAWFAANTESRIYHLRPLVSTKEIEELKYMASNIPADNAILTSTPLAPWVHGWTRVRVIAPGLLGDTHSAQEWISFTHGPAGAKIDFLKNFPRPLYIFLGPRENEEFLSDIKNCVDQKSDYLFRYTC